jgi:hypothetical protein
MRPVATSLAAELEMPGADVQVRFDEEVTQESLRRLAARELTAALVIETRDFGYGQPRVSAPEMPA